VAYKQGLPAAGALAAGEASAPTVSLSSRQRAAIAAFAWRVGRLTPGRAEEIASLASRAAPAAADGTSMTLRLVSIARWLHGEGRAG
jgi:hypothetical protein